MSLNTVYCIYCSAEVDVTAGMGDHVIPAALGEFRDDQRFRRICRSCNSTIGRSEQQLLQCGPERIYRDVVKPAAPSKRVRGRSGGRGSMGAPAPVRAIQGELGHELVHLDSANPDNVRPVDQLVVHRNGEDRFIRLFPGMRPEQLRKRLEMLGVTDLAGSRLHCDDSNGEEFAELVRQVSPSSRVEWGDPIEPGIYRVPARITAVVNKHYFQAIAKIAFHYYLVHNRRGLRGDENEFAAIRDFILNGNGEVESFFHSSGIKLALPFGPTGDGRLFAPSFWCHLLTAFEANGVIAAYVHLFLGPKAHRPGKYVTLGPFSSKIIVPSGNVGHLYRYDKSQPDEGSAGSVEAIEIYQRRW